MDTNGRVSWGKKKGRKSPAAIHFSNDSKWQPGVKEKKNSATNRVGVGVKKGVRSGVQR